jgi:hypothetical protein
LTTPLFSTFRQGENRVTNSIDMMRQEEIDALEGEQKGLAKELWEKIGCRDEDHKRYIMDPADQMAALVRGSEGKQLTYADLIGSKETRRSRMF